LASDLFDKAVAPLAQARKSAGEQSYFPLHGEANTISYYDEPLLNTMSAADFEFPGGGSAVGLIDALAALWTVEGETSLASMAPRLKEIALALNEEAAEGDGSVSILCYTMF
jgi:hypothetical protein